MLKNRPILKRILFSFLGIFLFLLGFGFWFFSLIPASDSSSPLADTRHNQLSYLENSIKESRGKILAVVTSTHEMGNSGKPTGYELTELARAYYVFKANGFDVDIASPLGGEPPVVIDYDDMGAFDYAFLNDELAQQKVHHSIPLSEVKGEQYKAIYFVGGKGAMYDFPQNEDIQELVKYQLKNNNIIGAVCHGPAALVNVKLDDGKSILTGKAVSGFTNEEELFLIPDAKDIFPFLLEDELVAQGAQFQKGPIYLKKISRDGNLITGQNPWSVWALAEAMIEQLGYTPIPRVATGEENTIDILATYERMGYVEARNLATAMVENERTEINRHLLAMHVVVATMQFEFGKSVDLTRLLNAVKI